MFKGVVVSPFRRSSRTVTCDSILYTHSAAYRKVVLANPYKLSDSDRNSNGMLQEPSGNGEQEIPLFNKGRLKCFFIPHSFDLLCKITLKS